MSYIIGVFGTIGSGKTAISKMIARKYGYYYIDGDALGHIILEETDTKNKIIELFGLQIISKEGFIDRKKLSQVVFANSLLKNKLELLLWPKMMDRILDSVKEKANVILEAALLFSAKWNNHCQATIYVEAPKEKVEKYLQKRNINRSLLEKIMDSQQEIINQRSLASYQIKNDGSFTDLEEKVEEIMNLIQKRRMEKKQPD